MLMVIKLLCNIKYQISVVFLEGVIFYLLFYIYYIIY